MYKKKVRVYVWKKGQIRVNLIIRAKNIIHNIPVLRGIDREKHFRTWIPKRVHLSWRYQADNLCMYMDAKKSGGPLH